MLEVVAMIEIESRLTREVNQHAYPLGMTTRCPSTLRQRELVYFKTQIERIGEPGVAANTTPIVQSLRR